MAYFTDPSRRYPPAVRAEAQLREYTDRTGGLILQMWELMVGRVWGEPRMMTMDEAALRLGRSEQELLQIIDQTNRDLGWVSNDQQT